MAVDVATHLTYSAIGNREDLSDAIYRIDPTDTPAMTGFEREKASAVNHEWQTQALAAVNSVNSVLEGDDATTDTATPTIVGTNQAKVAGAAATPRASASVISWIKTNTNSFNNTAAGSSTSGNPAAADGTGTRTDSTQRAFTESNLKTVLQSCWTNGGKPDTIMVGGFNKQVFSTFTGRATPTEDAKAKKIVASVEFYESDFGKLGVVPNRFQRARDCLVLQMDMWAVAFLTGRKMVSIPLARTGDSERRQILSEYTLVSRNEKASGGVYDLSTS